MRVHVVAWQYNTGAGFDWYASAQDADKAFHAERLNVLALASANWTAYRFDFDSHANEPMQITDEIDERIDELCQSATIVQGPGFAAINAASEAL